MTQVRFDGCLSQPCTGTPAYDVGYPEHDANICQLNAAPGLIGVGLTAETPSAIVAAARSKGGHMRRWLIRLIGVAGMLHAATVVAELRADQPSESDGAIDLTQPAPPGLTMRPVDLLNANPGGAARGSHRAAQDLGSQHWEQRGSTGDYRGPGNPPGWAGGRDQPLDSRPRF